MRRAEVRDRLRELIDARAPGDPMPSERSLCEHLGVSRPTASWGTMLSDGREFIRNYPHIAIAPGIAITITVLSFNLVGDGLRDALDPRQKE